jgi:S-adenosylmethionine:tRNA-ribosyltransferase-isomerase (queuine synthetase)
MLALLAAFYPDWKRAYELAKSAGFRFLSFGDAMLVLN